MAMMAAQVPRPVVWMGNSLDVLRGFPSAVQDEVGYGLYLAQVGSKHITAKHLKGFGPAVLEVLSDHRGDTFRAVYTVRWAEAVYVLHAFQKKSTKGVSTPQRELDLVEARLKLAEALHRKQEKH
jgi:phage-related protein